MLLRTVMIELRVQEIERKFLGQVQLVMKLVSKGLFYFLARELSLALASPWKTEFGFIKNKIKRNPHFSFEINGLWQPTFAHRWPQTASK